MAISKRRVGRRRGSATRETEIKQLVAMAEDPLDGLATLWDVAMLGCHNVVARRARLHGMEPPVPPAPVSRLLTGFTQQLREKTLAIANQLRTEETARLARVAPGFVAALETNEPDVMVLVRDLLPHTPDVIALWLRANLEVLERRFAS